MEPIRSISLSPLQMNSSAPAPAPAPAPQPEPAYAPQSGSCGCPSSCACSSCSGAGSAQGSAPVNGAYPTAAGDGTSTAAGAASGPVNEMGMDTSTMMTSIIELMMTMMQMLVQTLGGGGAASAGASASPVAAAPQGMSASAPASASAAAAQPASTAAPGSSGGPLGSGVPGDVSRWNAEIQAAAQKYDLDPNLLAAIIQTESSGNPNAGSSAGAVGLMQLMPATARHLGVTDRNDPAQSIDGGAKYLRENLDRFDGDITKALAAYNAGPGNIGAGMGYAEKVQGLYQQYRA